MRTTTTIDGRDAALVLLAAGSSSRMGATGKKEFLKIDDTESDSQKGAVLSVAAKVFFKTKSFSTIAITYQKNELRETKKAFYSSKETSELAKNSNVIFVRGGETRQKSVFRALKKIAESRKKNCGDLPQIVLIHDGARPFLSSALVQATLKAARKYGAATPALEPVETQKEIDSHKKIVRHLERKNLASVQTPQGFHFERILQYHRTAQKDGHAYTDDTEIWDKYSQEKTRVIPGESSNIKITYPKDVAKFSNEKKSCERQIKIGLGYDLHRLTEGRRLVLGGIEIPFEKGEFGHSDGDALLHAITDAVLGAAALGDIGSYFPDTDEKWKDADSRKLLATAWRDARKSGWRLENLDCVVKLQRPKFLPYRARVIKSIAQVLDVPAERVFVKAKTAEGLGEVGKGEAIECQAICLLSRTRE